ncbi:glycosyltransferase family 4 protein [Pedobacter frigiditerrae]|uniref:glycosyltransferase family 4 protein n=1 Tax=Pedobacter frigiditerrae TaxID=2530452 RepID=UPI00292F3E83|nr:glycosyltransferase family 4 protein [Pedobacter frigiditerrae]
MKKVILSHPTGNANVKAAANGFAKANLLAKFVTAIAVFKGTFAFSIFGIGPLKEFRRRTFPDSLKKITTKYPWNELARMMALKLKLRALVNHEVGKFSIDSICRHLDGKVAALITKEGEIDAVYAYEDAALASFSAAKKKSLICLYDLPIGYWRSMHELLNVEIKSRPAWAASMGGVNDSLQKLERKDQELGMSDHIFVASDFTKKTLQAYPYKLAPITVIPYGFPEVGFPKTYEPLINRPLRLLFVGGLSQRKGIANLFEAVANFGDKVTLTVVGRKPSLDCRPLDEYLEQHHWIPSLPHHEILQLMRENDIFVFPSLFEGFGLVITEAMSQGTPVITTERTCGPDLIEHGKNGWLIEAGNTNALTKQIEVILADPAVIEQNGFLAMETAKQRPWAKYEKELSEAVLKIIE